MWVSVQPASADFLGTRGERLLLLQAVGPGHDVHRVLPSAMSQRVLAGTILAGRLGVLHLVFRRGRGASTTTARERIRKIAAVPNQQDYHQCALLFSISETDRIGKRQWQSGRFGTAAICLIRSLALGRG